MNLTDIKDLYRDKASYDDIYSAVEEVEHEFED